MARQVLADSGASFVLSAPTFPILLLQVFPAFIAPVALKEFPLFAEKKFFLL
jgi:hypothetical protein